MTDQQRMRATLGEASRSTRQGTACKPGFGLCLVTSGAGFIGSSLVRSLVRLGARVRVFDNFSTGCHESLAGLEGCVDQVVCWPCRHGRVQ